MKKKKRALVCIRPCKHLGGPEKDGKRGRQRDRGVHGRTEVIWEGDCQVVCVNNKEIIGLCSPRASPRPPGGLLGLGGAWPWHYTQLGQQGGQMGRQGRSQPLSFMRGMSLCPGLSQGKARVTGKGPELGLCLEMKASC